MCQENQRNCDCTYYARFLETNFFTGSNISGTNMHTVQVCNNRRVCDARAWFLANLLRKRRRASEDKERKKNYRKVYQKIHLERTDSLYLIVRTAVYELQFSNTSHSRNCAYPALTWSSWLAKINAMVSSDNCLLPSATYRGLKRKTRSYLWSRPGRAR